jgi:hypothetical protein
MWQYYERSCVNTALYARDVLVRHLLKHKRRGDTAMDCYTTSATFMVIVICAGERMRARSEQRKLIDGT